MVQPLMLSQVLGYRLKQAHAAMRGAMDAALRGHGLTTPQYVCLELLAGTPGISNSDLARGAFVTRQSMNVVVQGLQERGLITRPDRASQGRSRPTQLTPAGERALEAARASIQAIETAMVADLTPFQQQALTDALATCAASLARAEQ